MLIGPLSFHWSFFRWTWSSSRPSYSHSSAPEAHSPSWRPLRSTSENGRTSTLYDPEKWGDSQTTVHHEPRTDESVSNFVNTTFTFSSGVGKCRRRELRDRISPSHTYTTVNTSRNPRTRFWQRQKRVGVDSSRGSDYEKGSPSRSEVR